MCKPERFSGMTSEKDRKKYIKLFAREQDFKDLLLKLQSQKLIDDLKGAEEIKKIQALLSDNQKKIQKLSKDSKEFVDNTSLLKELSYQVSDMQNQLTVHKRKLVAYREAAKKFKRDLDLAEERKQDFLEEIGMHDEYVRIQSAVRLTAANKAAEKTVAGFPSLSGNQKVKHRINEELTIDAMSSEVSDTLEPNTITVFSELDEYDDLSKIKGIGPKFEVLLNNEGVYTYNQIANWTEDEVKKRDKRLVFRGRIQREAWVDQAKQLISQLY